MRADDFSVNPCRRNIFDVFLIDKSETSIRVILDAVRNARNRWENSKLLARDGTELKIREAELNAFEKTLRDPLERIKIEQFVHQEQLFVLDEELAKGLQVDLETETPLRELEEQARDSLMGLMIRNLPELEFQPIDDDLPWPEEPGPCDLIREDLAKAILRNA